MESHYEQELQHIKSAPIFVTSFSHSVFCATGSVQYLQPDLCNVLGFGYQDPYLSKESKPDPDLLLNIKNQADQTFRVAKSVNPHYKSVD